MPASITDIAWWTSFSNCLICFIIRRIFRLLHCNSTDAAWPVCVLLLLDTVGCISCDDGLCDLVLLTGGAAASFVCFVLFCF